MTRSTSTPRHPDHRQPHGDGSQSEGAQPAGRRDGQLRHGSAHGSREQCPQQSFQHESQPQSAQKECTVESHLHSVLPLRAFCKGTVAEIAFRAADMHERHEDLPQAMKDGGENADDAKTIRAWGATGCAIPPQRHRHKPGNVAPTVRADTKGDSRVARSTGDARRTGRIRGYFQ